ncbi:hypothetical protein RvY_10772 [Ramazzottius varieornatus]|uniref:Uncharacterized protein n=1 Tax=Ramazzottius varieornatus TaxID=947166 RepID=A0A1D1VFX1_RAMVA|nr:hypothetical protein RvY_10772 [Ramazzottius varieornatus]
MESQPPLYNPKQPMPPSAPAPPYNPQQQAMYQPQPAYPPNPYQVPEQQPMLMHHNSQPQVMYQPNPGMMHHTNTIVVAPGGNTGQRTVVIEKKRKMQHWLHCLITILFPPWVFVWIVLCIFNSNKKPKQTVVQV